MCFDWMLYLDLAESICSKKESLGVDEEAICRCAVSRAYYATYCYLRNMALDYMYYQSPKDRISVHDHLIEFFRDEMALPAAGGNLARLREWRTACDYEDVFPKKHGSILYVPKGAFDFARQTIDLLNKRYLDPAE